MLAGCTTIPTAAERTSADIAATEPDSAAEAASGQSQQTEQGEPVKPRSRSETASAPESEPTLEHKPEPEATPDSSATAVATHDTEETQSSDSDRVWKGKASYYGQQFAGELTASGEIFDPDELTAAHRFLPFGTRVRVTNLENGQEITVRITDRGPFVEGRIIDVSRRAAEKLGMVEEGVVRVRVEVVD